MACINEILFCIFVLIVPQWTTAMPAMDGIKVCKQFISNFPIEMASYLSITVILNTSLVGGTNFEQEILATA